tara:strand:+ start:339 stop:725 length:387 start_codon:yes stop_codon:yes gene_type:complete
MLVKKLKKSDLRKSGLIFSLLLFLIFILLPYLIDSKLNLLPLILIFIVVFISIFKPSLLRSSIKSWIYLGNFLAKINSSVILFSFFYFFITPFALLRRFYIKIISARSKKTSYYVTTIYEKNDFRGQY